MKYRGEIDGLRALAVISVVLFHAQISLLHTSLFPGGFIGVDIFFVISGYLITKIILSKLFVGSFSFINFYERRIRRIMPMLLVVILVSFPFAFNYLLVQDFILYSESILASLFFISNFFFYFESIGYAQEASNPFLHTWSLGIEEQFYIFFPILLLVIYKFFRNLILIFLLSILLVSLLYAQHTSINNFDLSFYSTFSRIWELLMGSILAYIVLKYGEPKNNLNKEIFPIIGFALIIYSVVFFNTNTIHPGLLTLIPTVGTCLIIAFSSKKDLVGKILNFKPLIGVGLISYSLYLWHVPIFYFGHILIEAPNSYDKFIWILLASILSIVSYFVIEKPFRNKKIISSKLLIFSISILFIISATTNFIVYKERGFKSRLPVFLHDIQLDTEQWEQTKLNGQKCFDRSIDFCEFDNGANTWVNFAGDSHLASLSHELLSRKSIFFNVSLMNIGGCLFLLDQAGEENCGFAVQNSRFNKINEHDNSIVILGGRLPLYLTGKYFDNLEGGREAYDKLTDDYKSWIPIDEISQSFKTTIIKILDKGHKVILVYPIPELGFHLNNKIMQNSPKDVNNISSWLKDNPITTSYEVYKDRTESSFSLLDSINNKNLFRLYPHKELCDKQLKGRCISHSIHELFYIDADHLTNQGAKIINNLLLEKIDEIITKH